MIAIDTEAVKILQQYPGENRINVPVETLGQIKTAHELGLGSMDYAIVEASAHTHTEQEGVQDLEVQL